MFKTHNTELSLLLQNTQEDPSLRKIILRDDIKVYDEEELKASMLNFLIGFYSEERIRVKNSSMDYKNKSFTIRKIRENIFKLKQGKLVKYEK